MNISATLVNLTDNLIGHIRRYAEHNFTAFVVFCHLFFAAFFFSPYFLFNYVLLANTDMPDIQIPMLILAKRNLLQGHFGFWNPYLLGGTSSLLFASAPIYSVLDIFNWLLFVLPEKYLFLTGTFLPFVKLWLVGVFAYFFFYEEFQSQKWAFFASTIYQLCGYTLWNTFVFELSSMWLWLTVAIYLIWTAYKRRLYLTYIFLTLVLVQLLLPSYIVMGTHILILLGVLVLYRYLSQRNTRNHLFHLVTTASAVMTSVVIFALRLLPTWAEARLTNRLNPFAWDFSDVSFLGLRLFNPEVLGVNFITSHRVMTLTSVDMDPTIHIHNSFPQFFGVLPALLLLWAILSPKKGRITFWLIYVIVMLFAMIRIEPFDTAFRVLLYPIYHSLGLQVFLPIGVCMVVGLTAKNLEESKAEFVIPQGVFRLFIFALIVILGYIFTVWLTNFPDQAGLARVAIGVVAVLTILVWLFHRQWPDITSRVLAYLGLFTIAALLILGLYLLFLANDPNKTFLSHLKMISTSLILLILSYVGIWIGVNNASRLKVWGLRLAFPLVVGFLLVTLYPRAEALRELPSRVQDFQLATLGAVRFLIISVIFITILIWLRQQKLPKRWLFACFLLVLVFDLLPASKIHGFLLTNPFYRYSNIFPTGLLNPLAEDGSSLELDTRNYRVNMPHSMLPLPYHQELYGSDEAPTAAYPVYGLRSYGGYYTGISKRYQQFISALAPQADLSIQMIRNNVKNERFLDLSGVRYDYDTESRTIQIRPNARSRFMLFNTYEVIEDDQKTLERLEDPEFSPLETVILDRDPGISQGNSDHRAKELEFTEYSTDVIELNVTSKLPGIVLFNDTYHPDWHVFVDGQEQPIIHADYNFMAASVPAGESKVVFRYQPRFFYYGVYLAGVGVLLFLIISVTLYVVRNRIDEMNAEAIREQVSLKRRILSNFRAFRLIYLSFIFLLLVAIAQALFNYHEAALYYKEFYIIDHQDKYYVLPYATWPIDQTDASNLSKCYRNGQCTITNSLEEAKQFVDQPIEQRGPVLIEEGYHGFNILHYQNKYYAVPQSPWLFNLLDIETLNICQADDQCTIADTLEETKQQVDALLPLTENKLSSLIKTVTTSSPHPVFSGERLFDWHSDQWSEFPQSIDVVFRQPVKLEGLGFQAQVQDGKKLPTLQLVLLGGEDFERPQFETLLTFELFAQSEELIFLRIPDLQEKYQHYRIIFLGGQAGEYPEWLTIQKTQLYALVEGDYNGFNIYWDQNNYYAVAQDLEPVDIANISNLNECYQGDQCGIASSLEEAKQLASELANRTP